MFNGPEEMAEHMQRMQDLHLHANTVFHNELAHLLRDGVDYPSLAVLTDVLASIANANEPGEIANWFEGMFRAAKLFRHAEAPLEPGDPRA